MQQTSFEVGQTRIAGGTTLITFGGKLDKLSPAQLRDILKKANWDSDERLKAESARPVSPDHLVAELIKKLRELLAKYIATETDYTGAWHLGSDLSERKKIQRVLTQFYRAASNVVHGEAINEKKGDLKWLEQARDVCRRGILKIIEEEKQPDWNELLLGQRIE